MLQQSSLHALLYPVILFWSANPYNLHQNVNGESHSIYNAEEGLRAEMIVKRLFPHVTDK